MTKDMKILSIIIALVSGMLVATWLHGQTPLTLPDLKLMIADRDITIEIQGRQIRDLKAENENLRAKLAKLNPEDCSILADTACQH